MPKDSTNGVDEADDFLAYVQAAYPESADHWRALESEAEFTETVTDEGYTSAGADPGLSFGVVFYSGGPDWEYKARGTVTGYGFGWLQAR